MWVHNQSLLSQNAFLCSNPVQTTVHSPPASQPQMGCRKVSRVLFSLVASFIKQDEEKCPCMPPVQLLQRLSPPPTPPTPTPKSCCLSASVFLPATLFLISRASEETDKVQNPKLTVCLYSAETRLFMENRPDAWHSRSDQTLSTTCIFYPVNSHIKLQIQENVKSWVIISIMISKIVIFRTISMKFCIQLEWEGSALCLQGLDFQSALADLCVWSEKCWGFYSTLCKVQNFF